MKLSEQIILLRKNYGLSQEGFAERIGVSRQAVQKWENGSAEPGSFSLREISKKFNISLDRLICGRSARETEELSKTERFLPDYTQMEFWDRYSGLLMYEYTQCDQEGKEIRPYRELFSAVEQMPEGVAKSRIANELFLLTATLEQREDFPYVEPSEWETIKEERDGTVLSRPLPSEEILREKISGAWYGRICGCLLGKPIECIRIHELTPFLKESGNYPLRRYVRTEDVDRFGEKYTFTFRRPLCADLADGMPADDDTNYTVIAQRVIETYGDAFTPYDVSREWLNSQTLSCYCTAEHIAYRNFINGYFPPTSAVYQNPAREWIGAQIRGDYFGYINPGDPERAAEFARRDASVSHVKNGIYGEMLIAAMLACAAVTDELPEIIRGGLGQIPKRSRLYEAITEVLNGYEAGVTKEDFFRSFYDRFDDRTDPNWVHTIPNAMIVTAALLYGEGNYEKSICMAVEAGFDTDCNGATVGSILGMRNGRSAIGEVWTAPVGDILHTTINGAETLRIADLIDTTMAHIEKYGKK